MDPGLRHISRASRRQQTPDLRPFDRAAEEEAFVFAHHFPPFPNLGHVIKERKGDCSYRPR